MRAPARQSTAPPAPANRRAPVPRHGRAAGAASSSAVSRSGWTSSGVQVTDRGGLRDSEGGRGHSAASSRSGGREGPRIASLQRPQPASAAVPPARQRRDRRPRLVSSAQRAGGFRAAPGRARWSGGNCRWGGFQKVRRLRRLPSRRSGPRRQARWSAGATTARRDIGAFAREDEAARPTGDQQQRPGEQPPPFLPEAAEKLIERHAGGADSRAMVSYTTLTCNQGINQPSTNHSTRGNVRGAPSRECQPLLHPALAPLPASQAPAGER